MCSVSGKRRGKGSSREQSPYAEMAAGIQLVIAENIERIYKQNCQNLGLLTSTDFSLIDKVRGGEEIALVNSPRAKTRSRAKSSSTEDCFPSMWPACRRRSFCRRSGRRSEP